MGRPGEQDCGSGMCGAKVLARTREGRPHRSASTSAEPVNRHGRAARTCTNEDNGRSRGLTVDLSARR